MVGKVVTALFTLIALVLIFIPEPVTTGTGLTMLMLIARSAFDEDNTEA